MNSQFPNELISAYFDGEASPDERAEVERLLESSEDARREFNEVAKLSALLHSIPRESAPEELASNVQRKTSQLAMPSSGSSHRFISVSHLRWREIRVAAATAACCLVGMFLWNRSSDKPRSEPALAASNHLKQIRHGLEKAPQSDPSRASGFLSENQQEIAEQIASNDRSKMGGFGGTESRSAMNRSEVQSLTNPLASAAAGNSGMFPQPDLNPQVATLNDEYIKGLEAGYVFQQIDPERNVPVISLTVVDVNNGLSEMQSLLIRNDFSPQIVNEAAKSKSDATKSEDPELFVYVVGPGKQLADALSDARQHPDLFRNIEIQPPVPLESVEVAAAADGVRSKDDLRVRQSDEAQTVANIYSARRANPMGNTVLQTEEGLNFNRKKNPSNADVKEAEKRDESVPPKPASISNSGRDPAVAGAAPSEKSRSAYDSPNPDKSISNPSNFQVIRRSADNSLGLGNTAQQQQTTTFEAPLNERLNQNSIQRNLAARNPNSVDASKRLRMLFVIQGAQPEAAAVPPAKPDR